MEEKLNEILKTMDKHITWKSSLKLVCYLLLFYFLFLIFGYKITTDKVNVKNRKNLIDFEKDYQIPESINKRQNPLKDFREKRRLKKENRKNFFK